MVKAGDRVAVGDPLMVMIAMKMEVRPSTCFDILHLTWCIGVTHSFANYLFVLCLCSTPSGRPSLVSSRGSSSARALRPIVTLPWWSWRRRRRRRGAASERTQTHNCKRTVTGGRELELVTVTTGGEGESLWTKLGIPDLIHQLRGWVWLSLERMRQKTNKTSALPDEGSREGQGQVNTSELDRRAAVTAGCDL